MYSTVPEETVSSLLRTCPVTRAELHYIRDRRNPDRFHSVYQHVHGSRTRSCGYRARVFKFFELGSGFANAEVAARAVVAFYKFHFTHHWSAVFANRKVTPWRIRCASRRYEVDLYVRGEATAVAHDDKSVWHTRDDAKRAVRGRMAQIFDAERTALTIPAPGLIFWRT